MESIARAGGRVCPLYDDSDDEEMVIKRKSNGQIDFENKERIELEQMFGRDDQFFKQILEIEKNLDDSIYVKMCIK